MTRPCHVMVVDDEQDFRESVSLLLGFEGFVVSPAADGRQALTLLASGTKPDVILLDQRMPGLSGTETLKHLREQGIDVPAVLVSAVADVASLAEEHRFDAALGKPFSPQELTDLIRRLLSARGISCGLAD